MDKRRVLFLSIFDGYNIVEYEEDHSLFLISTYSQVLGQIIRNSG